MSPVIELWSPKTGEISHSGPAQYEDTTITYVMSFMQCLPDDPKRCQRLLEDLLRRNDELQRQAEDARHQAEESQRRIEELQRVLDQTAADYSQLQERHAELAETLALLRRSMFG